MFADRFDWRRDKQVVRSALELVVGFGVDSACSRYVKISDALE